MIQSQTGFFYAIFASSIIISILLIFSFTVFVFKYGFTQPNPFYQAQNYKVLQSTDFEGMQAFKNTSQLNYTPPSWTGRFSIDQVNKFMESETKYFVDLKDYFYEAIVGNISPNSNYSKAAYEIRNAKKFGYEGTHITQ